jgi:hypothetical protein
MSVNSWYSGGTPFNVSGGSWASEEFVAWARSSGKVISKENTCKPSSLQAHVKAAALISNTEGFGRLPSNNCEFVGTGGTGGIEASEASVAIADVRHSEVDPFKSDCP